MTSFSIVQWLSSTALSQFIQSTYGAIAGLQVVHLVSLSVLFACALLLGLRVVGRGLIDETAPVLAGKLLPAIWISLVLLAITGALLIVAEPFRTITNRIFYLKMALLVAAVVLTIALSAIARRPPDHPVAAGVRISVAASSMLVWIAIMFAGRFIAYT